MGVGRQARTRTWPTRASTACACCRPTSTRASEDFTVCAEGIRFGLGAVKGVGQKAIELITQAREDGAFRSLGDFCLRAGGVAGQPPHHRGPRSRPARWRASSRRARGCWPASTRRSAWAERVREDRGVGPDGPVRRRRAAARAQPEPALPHRRPSWTRLEVLEYEHDAVGFFISGPSARPLSRRPRPAHGDAMADLDVAQDGSNVRVAGVTNTVRRKNSKKGERYATFNIEDREGVVEVIAWPDCYRRCETAIVGREPVIVLGRLEFGEVARPARRGQRGRRRGRRPTIRARPRSSPTRCCRCREARRKAARSRRPRASTAARSPRRHRQAALDAAARYPGRCRPYLQHRALAVRPRPRSSCRRARSISTIGFLQADGRLSATVDDAARRPRGAATGVRWNTDAPREGTRGPRLGRPGRDACRGIPGRARAAGRHAPASTWSRGSASRSKKLSAATRIGSGKVEELKSSSPSTKADVVDLRRPADAGPTPQPRERRRSQIKVLDRSQLILDIFAHARPDHAPASCRSSSRSSSTCCRA